MAISPPPPAAGRLLTLLAPALMGATLPAGLLIGPVRMRAMVTEDRPVEWLQVGLLVSAALLLLRCWTKLRGVAGRQFDARVYGLMALVAVVVALEEISWGQRLIGFRTPEELAEANRQGEFNLHNLAGFHGIRNWLPLAFSALGTACAAWDTRRPPAGGASPRWHRLLPGRALLFSMVVCLAISLWMLVLYLTRLLPHDDWRAGRVVAEWSELLVAYVVFLYAYQRSLALPSSAA